MVEPSTSARLRIDEKASGLIAELCALQLAVNFILERSLHRSIIFSDSPSTPEAIYSPNLSKNHLVLQIKQSLY